MKSKTELNPIIDQVASAENPVGMDAVCVHALILRSHESTPPMLPLVPFLALLIGFLFLVGVWTLVLHRRFRRPA